MTTMGLRLARWSLLLLAGFCLLGGPVRAEKEKKAEDKPIVLRVKLPADAALFIDGVKTTQTGADRSFESPPVAVGKTYSYHIKAVWKQDGKEVVREEKFAVKAGQVNELNLLAAPKASLKVQAPASVDVEAGSKATIPLTFTTENIKGGITVTLDGAPPASRVDTFTLIPGVKNGSVEVQVDKKTKAGTHELVVKGSADGATAEAKVKLNVKAAPPPPPPLAKLKLDVPASVAVEAGAKKPLAIKITREHFKGSVKVSFTGQPESIKLHELTIPEDKSEATVELAPPADAKAGSSEVTVKAEGASAKAESKLKLDIKPNKDVKPAEKDKDKPKDKDAKDKDKPAGKDKDKPKDK